ncbi:MAG TPA: GWxTD domain-containing protein [Gemmatimonadales bacterium]|jgi:GWxTD domain-containing protein|nr:GWxTD domain-containing protein [Gemmatimonadales bacterium]
MQRFSSAFLAAAAIAVPIAVPVSQSESGLVLRAVRFYRSDQNRTRVTGLVQIPFSLIQPARNQPGQVNYVVSVRVVDSAGLSLYQQAWSSRAQHPGTVGGYTVEIVDFVIAPGKYKLDVGVIDSVSGRKASGRLELEALSKADRASDLLVAPEIRVADKNDTVPRPGEFRVGNALVTAAASVLLTPLRTNVYYLLEAYSDTAEAGTMSVAIRDSTGSTIMKTPAVPVELAVGGSVLRGQLDLAGLPQGRYAMTATLQLGTQRVERSASISMAGLNETLARDTARRSADRITDEGYFGAMSEAELEEARAPLIHLAESRELSAWDDQMSLQARRRFLSEFWKGRDPSPGTPRNERREAFYSAIEYANRAYREGGRNPVPGWRSDRGGIYVKNGQPDDVLRRQQEGRAPPYEVWRYTKGKGYYYIFADRSGFGGYDLIHTNDLKEPTPPGWVEVLGGPAVEDVGRFLGLDFTTMGSGF